MKLYREKRVKAKKLSAADHHDENSEGDNGGDATNRAGPNNGQIKRSPSSDDRNRRKEKEPDILEEQDFMLFGRANMGIFGVFKR